MAALVRVSVWNILFSLDGLLLVYSLIATYEDGGIKFRNKCQALVFVPVAVMSKGVKMGYQCSFSVVLGSNSAAAYAFILGVVHSVKGISGSVSNKRLMSKLRSVASFLWRKHTIKKKPLHFVAIGER